jgi:predicted SnoaL-like aldol condensation-catalyzing enzyme
MTDQQHLERNKKNVMAFYDLMFNQNNPAEAIKSYVGEVYIQHNPSVADGKRLSLTILIGWQKSILASVFTSNG